MTERRYTDDEAAAIFERAARAQQGVRRELSPGDGMTLRDLQEIGGEVGIPAELIAQAAGTLAPVRALPGRRFLGLPIGVGRTVDLDRHLTESEWDRLVVDLRETFAARGRVRADGALRQWTNGNLQALLEPTRDGQRLRLQTMKGDSRSFMLTGVALVATAGITLLAKSLAGGLDGGAVSGMVFLVATGLAMFGMGAARVPAWARRRREQMEAIAARVARVAAALPADRSESPPDQPGRAEDGTASTTNNGV